MSHIAIRIFSSGPDRKVSDLSACCFMQIGSNNLEQVIGVTTFFWKLQTHTFIPSIKS